MFIFAPNQNEHLFRVAYAIMIQRGKRGMWDMIDDCFLAVVLHDVLIENTWCRPPLTRTEVKGIVANAAKWAGYGQVEQDRIRFARI
jgi:hypothetical protein